MISRRRDLLTSRAGSSMLHCTLDEGAVEALRRAGPQMPITAAPLSARLRGALSALGVEVVADAAEVSARALLHQAGVGRKALAEIQEALEVFGMHLRDDSDQRGQQASLPID